MKMPGIHINLQVKRQESHAMMQCDTPPEMAGFLPLKKYNEL
jgi:hypothetical protein